MANSLPITLAGGVKAPPVALGLPPGPSRSRIVIAFAALSDLIAEAAEAEARLQAPQSWDIACSAITAEDAEAFEAARLAAKSLMAMPYDFPTDRPLLKAARFLFQGLSLETAALRADYGLALRGTHAGYLTGEARHMTAEAVVLIDLAMSRLWTLFAILDADLPYELVPEDMHAEDGGDPDQEVQAF